MSIKYQKNMRSRCCGGISACQAGRGSSILPDRTMNKEQLQLLDEEELIDIILQQYNTISEIIYINSAHCDLLAQYIVDYAKDKFNAS